MTLKLVEIKEDDLPDNTTHGFKLVEDGQVQMFFHWHEVPIEDQLTDKGAGSYKAVRTDYSDVLTALPDRLAAMGYGDQADEILGEVVAKFGAG